MICPQCKNGNSGLGGMTHVGVDNQYKVVWWCETCGTLICKELDDDAPLVPTLIRRVDWMLKENERNAKFHTQSITDIMGKVD